jgi:guanosine-3',5'-bis(diphosphate) 3'-pyrophosphohydrolase
MKENVFNNEWWTEESSLWFEKLSDEEAFENIVDRIIGNHGNLSIQVVRAAWNLSTSTHKDQSSRYSKRRVLRHILAVAKTVTEIGLDSETIAAAMLHDILEETDITYSQLEENFGSRIANIVFAVSRYDSKDTNKSEAGHQRDILKKLFDTLSINIDDLPAVFIKLAEKYDHLRFSIQYLSYEQRRDMANEIMTGYAPLAERLGVYRLKAELEDLAFRTTNYEDYISIARQLQVQRENTDAFFRKTIPELKTKLFEAGLNATVSARRKHIYSTYEKMRRKGKKFLGVVDLVGVRILVDSISDCYSVLRIVHEIWRPMPREFDDYIGLPKQNGYQSLHTTVVSEGFAIEIQIRTMKMHEVAEFGLAAHWRYKGSGDLENELLNALYSALQKQFDVSRRTDDIEEFFKSLSDDMLQEQIHVYFIGNGELISLPKESTPIDLAYAVSEELAIQTVGAKVREFEVPLDWQLSSGDRVMLLTSSEHNEPEREWLTFVKTGRAKEAIRKSVQKFPREINVHEGLPILLGEINLMGIDIPIIDVAFFSYYSNPDDLLYDVGSGNVNARDIAEMLFKRPYKEDIIGYSAIEMCRIEKIATPDRIILSECCKPDLGKQLVASYDKSILMIHRTDCPKLINKAQDRLLKLPWLDPKEIIITVHVRIKARDRVGLLSDVTNLLSKNTINIISIESSKDSNNLITVDLEIDILYTVKLSDLLHKLILNTRAENARHIENSVGQIGKKWKIASQLEYNPRPENGLYPVLSSQKINSQVKYGSAVINKSKLRVTIDTAFDLEELAILCAEVEQKMQENNENVHLSLDTFGINRPKLSLIQDLIQYLYRRNLLGYLLEAINIERPNLLDDVIGESDDVNL